jgi:hypothetical protein
MRWKSAAAVRASFALVLLPRVGRRIRRWRGWASRRLGLLLGLLFLGFGWGISRAFVSGQLFPRLRGRLGNPRLQFLGGDLLGTRTKEAPLVNGYRVLQVAPNMFQLRNLSFQGFLLRPKRFHLGQKRFLVRRPRLPLGLPGLEFLAQAPILRR